MRLRFAGGRLAKIDAIGDESCFAALGGDRLLEQLLPWLPADTGEEAAGLPSGSTVAIVYGSSFASSAPQSHSSSSACFGAAAAASVVVVSAGSAAAASAVVVSAAEASAAEAPAVAAASP